MNTARLRAIELQNERRTTDDPNRTRQLQAEAGIEREYLRTLEKLESQAREGYLLPEELEEAIAKSEVRKQKLLLQNEQRWGVQGTSRAGGLVDSPENGVKMKTPDGRTLMIRPDAVAEAENLGAVRVQ